MLKDSAEFDVAIIGGGPGGSTAATALRKHAPDLRVIVLEREKFPRDHVGESLLPYVGAVLERMGCWDKIEAADFPVKVGATYRWGSSDDLWDFDFLAGDAYEDLPRPGKYEGQRIKTAFQVDRAIYDQILLEHARSLGAEIREETAVREVLREGDIVQGLRLADGSVIKAKWYLDCSGSSGILRRSLGIETYEPSPLRNVAVWAYWQNAEWAVSIGVSGTRIQVMSLGWGWIWFIPLGPTRTSVGLVVPAEYYRRAGKKLEELYQEALVAEPRIKDLLKNAKQEPDIQTTKDWSFVSSRMAGPNWFLVGEAAGFADPILSAGLTLTHASAWEAALSIKDAGKFDPEWLRSEYERQQTRRIRTHIRFADFWYRANVHFSDLIEFTSEVAKEAGLALDGKAAWQWLGSGGFVDTDMGGAGIGGFTLVSASWLVSDFIKSAPQWQIGKNNLFHLNLDGSTQGAIASYSVDHIEQIPSLFRNDRILPKTDLAEAVLAAVQSSPRIDQIMAMLDAGWCRQGPRPRQRMAKAMQTFEALVNDGWIVAVYAPNLPLLEAHKFFEKMDQFHKNTDNRSPQPPLVK